MRMLDRLCPKISKGAQERAWIEEAKEFRSERVKTVEDAIRFQSDFGRKLWDQIPESSAGQPRKRKDGLA